MNDDTDIQIRCNELKEGGSEEWLKEPKIETKEEVNDKVYSTHLSHNLPQPKNSLILFRKAALIAKETSVKYEKYRKIN